MTIEQLTSKEKVLPKTELEWIAHALNDAAVALPVLFTMLAKIGAREGAMVADEILGHVKCAQKQCGHLVEAERRAAHEPCDLQNSSAIDAERHSSKASEEAPPSASNMRGHPEDFCERCKRPNCTWFAPSPIWNAAHCEWDILCPICFVQLAEAAGITPTAWQVAPEVLESTPPPRAEHPLSSGDAIACIGMALQNPDTDEWPQLLGDCMHVIERMEGELLDAKRQRNAEVKLRQAAERAAPPPTALPAEAREVIEAFLQQGDFSSPHWLGEKARALQMLGGLYAETKSEFCPHGMPLAENICGPCSQGRPNRAPVETSAVCQCHHIPRRAIDGNKCLRCGLPVSEEASHDQ